MKLSLKEWMGRTLSFLKLTKTRHEKCTEVITSGQQSHYNSAAGAYNICQTSLKPNMLYLVFGGANTDNGALLTMHTTVQVSGDATKLATEGTKQYSHSGQGGFAFALVRTGSGSSTTYIENYAYGTGYTEYSRLTAIPLAYLGGVLRKAVISTLSAISKIGGGVDEDERKGVARESNEQGKGSVRLASAASCGILGKSRHRSKRLKLYSAEAIQKASDNTANMGNGELHTIRLQLGSDKCKSVIIHSAEFHKSGRRVCTFKRHCPIVLVDIPHGLAISERRWAA